jgi:serine/threonine protein kinase
MELASRYRLNTVLGSGGMGQVWRARDLRLGSLVAVKVLPDGVHGDQALARLRREAEAAARLNHPAITTVHDVGVHEDRFFLVFELLHGRDLGVVAGERPGLLPIGSILDYGAQIADGLAAAHRAGVVHR